MGLSLDNLEQRLQSLIEVHLVNLLPGRKAEDVIAKQLATAVRSNISEGQPVPNRYIIFVNPNSLDQWNKDPRLLEGLSQILRLIASEANFKFEAPPSLTFSTDPSLGLDEIKISGANQPIEVAETQNMPQNPDGVIADETIPKNAFLIIGGVRVFPLSQPVINIGRRMDNNLVIDDPRVSRYHAQIRAIKGRYVIFDLNSTGGTYVNGQRTNQTVLYPGDVISLAGLPVIFGQDNPPAYTKGSTAPISPVSSERPTATLKPIEKPESDK
jgi:hypothetical protein